MCSSTVLPAACLIVSSVFTGITQAAVVPSAPLPPAFPLATAVHEWTSARPLAMCPPLTGLRRQQHHPAGSSITPPAPPRGRHRVHPCPSARHHFHRAPATAGPSRPPYSLHLYMRAGWASRTFPATAQPAAPAHVATKTAREGRRARPQSPSTPSHLRRCCRSHLPTLLTAPGPRTVFGALSLSLSSSFSLSLVRPLRAAFRSCGFGDPAAFPRTGRAGAPPTQRRRSILKTSNPPSH